MAQGGAGGNARTNIGLDSNGGEGFMSGRDRKQSTREIEELVTAIKDMASRVSTTFVIDERKVRNFIAARESRQRLKFA